MLPDIYKNIEPYPPRENTASAGLKASIASPSSRRDRKPDLHLPLYSVEPTNTKNGEACQSIEDEKQIGIPCGRTKQQLDDVQNTEYPIRTLCDV